MEEYFERLLDHCLDYGITEADFWEMTIGEIDRLAKSKARVRKVEAQEKATFDYIQAQLIIKGVGMVLGSKEKFPEITAVYPTVFDDLIQEQQATMMQKKAELSALRFKQFAQAYNRKFT